MTKGHVISLDIHLQLFSSVAELKCLWQNLALNVEEQNPHSYGEKRPMGTNATSLRRLKKNYIEC